MDSAALKRAIDVIVHEKKIPEDDVYEALELGLVTAYKKNFDSATNVRVRIDRDLGDIHVYSFKNVVEEIEDEDTDLLLEDAQKIVPGIQIGETIENEVTPKDFGRVAASTAKQVVTQKLREAERESILKDYEHMQDELVVGTVAMEDARNYYIDLGRTRGVLPKKEIIPGEHIQMNSSLKVYISKIESTSKGPFILLTRKHYGFVKRLFEKEIPELQEGLIVLYGVAREAGVRSKVAVYSTNSSIDAVGSCIGPKGSRIDRIIKELNHEKIDMVLYDTDPMEFIRNALSPAKNVSVFVTDEEKREALVIVDRENLSLAIGKGGINVKLAARLTGYKLDVKTEEQASEAGINVSR